MNVLVTHVFGFQNKGDWALFESLLNSINTTFPGCRVSGICRDPDAQHRYFPTVKWYSQYGTSKKTGLVRRIENVSGLFFPLLALLFPVYLLNQLFSIRKQGAMAAYHSADLIIACPGGYIEDSNVSIITNLVHLALGIKFKKKYILAPQSIGPIRSKLWSLVANRLFNKCAAICVRENYSLEEIRRLGVNSSIVHLFLDMAFYYPNLGCNDDSLRFDINEQYIAMTCIDWYFPFSQNVESQRALYEESLVSFIKMVFDKYKFKTVLLKQIENTSGICGDDDLLLRIHTRTKLESIYFTKDFSPGTMKKIIRGSCGFVGSRMHSNIFALQEMRPIVAISYLPKTTFIMRQLGLIEFVMPIENLSSQKLFELFNHALDSGAEFEKAHTFLQRESVNECSRFCKLMYSVAAYQA